MVAAKRLSASHGSQTCDVCLPVLIQVHNVKRFWVLNPTSMAYSFAWEALDLQNPGSASPFQCSSMTGVLAPGKRYEMVFQYTPSEDKLQACHVVCHVVVTGITCPVGLM